MGRGKCKGIMGVAGQYTIRRYGIRRLDHNRMPRLGDLDLSTMSCRLGIPPVTPPLGGLGSFGAHRQAEIRKSREDLTQ